MAKSGARKGSAKEDSGYLTFNMDAQALPRPKESIPQELDPQAAILHFHGYDIDFVPVTLTVRVDLAKRAIGAGVYHYNLDQRLPFSIKDVIGPISCTLD
ncbi:MAG: hypothetical protein LBT59_01815 [Clostridiales bacterium]|jgi:hypothetical protein|nr:hypothetical protein [Clostridiales bacterium]